MNTIYNPNFAVNFWLKHFKGMDEIEQRYYEATLLEPISNTMFFADTTEYYDEDFLDCTDLIDTLEQKFQKKTY